MSKNCIAPSKRNGDIGLGVVIPAAGGSFRMRTLSKVNLPTKPGEILLERTVRHYHKILPDTEIVVGLGKEIEEVAKKLPYPARVIENERWETTNMGRTLQLMLRVTLATKLVIHCGDTLLQTNIFDGFDKSKIYIDNSLSDQKPSIIDGQGPIEHINYGLPNKFAQILYLNEHDTARLKKILADKNSDKWVTVDIINKLIAAGAALHPVMLKPGTVFEVDSYRDIQRMRAWIKN